MKVIIAGGRDMFNYSLVLRAVSESGFQITEVVSGKANGVDALGERYAHQSRIPVKEFPADWKMFGKAAGGVRNAQMAEYAEALIAVWDGQSRGTKNMIEQARKRDLKIFIYTYERP